MFEDFIQQLLELEYEFDHSIKNYLHKGSVQERTMIRESLVRMADFVQNVDIDFNVAQSIEKMEDVINYVKKTERNHWEDMLYATEKFYRDFLGLELESSITKIIFNLSKLKNKVQLEKFHQLLKELGVYEKLNQGFNLHPQIEEVQRFASIKDW